ncbi:MAG: S1C family serine protease [Candidatus Rokuibacteriota bacterium]
MSPRLSAAAFAAVLVPAVAFAVPLGRERAPHPSQLSSLPSFVQRVEPAIVGVRATAPEGAASSARLGSRRFGSAAVFDPRGYAVTVSYVVLDAVAIEAQLRDGRVVPARLAAIDLDSGLAVIHLEGAGPWPSVTLGRSEDVQPGTATGTVAVDEDNELIYVASSVQSVRRFSAFWEYMLERAFMVAPSITSWGGSVVIDDRGRVVGIVSLRLGEAPYVNLAIPVERFVSVKDELIAAGRVVSRRPRPYLGLNTVSISGAVFVDGFNDVGPARTAGFLRGDQIIRVDGVAVVTQEQFYEQMWRRQAGDTIEVAVQRAQGVRVISVRSIDRHRLYPLAQ